MTATCGSIVARFRSTHLRVGVIGLGYVGLPLALLFARQGFQTTGFELDPMKLDKLNRYETYIHHVPAESIRKQKRRFHATADFQQLTEMDAIIICVPTPLDDHRQPDLTAVHTTTDTVQRHLRPGQLVVLESTTYPGTTDEMVLPTLRKSGLQCTAHQYSLNGNQITASAKECCEFMLAFSPEREDPGNAQRQTAQIPKILGAVNSTSAAAAYALYSQVFKQVVLVSSARVAEMTKLLENTYRCVNIALINELKLLSRRMGIDIWETIDAAKTKPFGFTAFYPGPGVGGHCIPIDPFYLTWKARQYSVTSRFIELAGEINSQMPEYIVSSIADALERTKQCVNGSHIVVAGVAYKKDVDDVRESPSLRIIELLQARGAHVDYHDPYCPCLINMNPGKVDRLLSVELTAELLKRCTAVVISTDHSSYDYHFIVRHAKLVIDTRNATRNVRHDRHKIVCC
jgi:UDP-N-acetyl-D-glucosamine dehydrogenase